MAAKAVGRARGSPDVGERTDVETMVVVVDPLEIEREYAARVGRGTSIGLGMVLWVSVTLAVAVERAVARSATDCE